MAGGREGGNRAVAEREKWISVTRVDCIHFGGKVELGDVKERDKERKRENRGG